MSESRKGFSRNANIVTQLLEVNLLIPYLCKTDWKVYNNTTVSCNRVLHAYQLIVGGANKFLNIWLDEQALSSLLGGKTEKMSVHI